MSGRGGMGGGWDMAGALALAGALGVSPWLVAELLPDIEAAALSAKNEPTEGEG